MRVTGRTTTFLITAFLLYLAANQTQVNWLYVTAALIAGVVPAALALNRGALRGLAVEREIETEAEKLHEGDPVTVRLKLAAERRGLAQVRLTETCPLAPLDDPHATFDLFLPRLGREQPLTHAYNVTADRRGLYHFPAVAARSRAPFGLFERYTEMDVRTGVLVFPEVRSLERLALLDQRAAVQMSSNRAGIGNELMGVRAYRPGDSPRHIHWRGVARTGRLVSKEFEEETQPGVSIVLDRAPHPADADPKHNAFEYAIKAAVSIAEYARRRRYPVHLHADAGDLPPPNGAVTWDALMQWSARVAPTDEADLAALLARGGFRQFVAVVVTAPSDALLTPLVGLKNTGARLLVAVADPASFPGGGASGAALLDALRAEDIDAVGLTYGPHPAEALMGEH